MPFSGKATYSAGVDLPEIAEDVSDVVSMASPHDTPLLEALGDGARPARSTTHEWLEDALLGNTDVVRAVDAPGEISVYQPNLFRPGDLARPEGGREVMLVTAVNADVLSVTRGYGQTPAGTVAAGQTLHIIGNAALEGEDASAARFTTRARRANHTQIFAATVEISGSELAVNQIGVRDELQYQRAQRVRELLRDLENSVINGAGGGTPGDAATRRTMTGLIRFLDGQTFVPGQGGFPAGDSLTEEQLNLGLRGVWERSAGNTDLVVVGGREKRAINNFVSTNRRFSALGESFRDRVSVYESDFGTCRIALSRHVPAGCVLLLDSSRVKVVPLAGRHFHYKPLARTGDRETGQVVGEYTLELRNPEAHGLIRLL